MLSDRIFLKIWKQICFPWLHQTPLVVTIKIVQCIHSLMAIQEMPDMHNMTLKSAFILRNVHNKCFMKNKNPKSYLKSWLFTTASKRKQEVESWQDLYFKCLWLSIGRTGLWHLSIIPMHDAPWSNIAVSGAFMFLLERWTQWLTCFSFLIAKYLLTTELTWLFEVSKLFINHGWNFIDSDKSCICEWMRVACTCTLFHNYI